MTELYRLEGWEARLYAFLDERRSQPFAWGGNDCASFAVAWVRRLTGVDVWPVTWSDEATAQAAIDAAGGLELAATQVLGPPLDNWRMARRGDVALAQIIDGPSLLVSLGHALVGPGLKGVDFLRADRALKVWRIG